MYRDIWERWIQALRSGEYSQGGLMLRKDSICPLTGKNRLAYCCLGVLCDLHSKETGGEWESLGGHFVTYAYLGNAGLLSQAVVEWAGLPRCRIYGDQKGLNVMIGRKAASMLNDDDKLTFPEIADLIEAHIVPIERVPK